MYSVVGIYRMLKNNLKILDIKWFCVLVLFRKVIVIKYFYSIKYFDILF